MNNTSGIYKIVNTVNNKFYIGMSKKLKSRKCYHFYELRKNRHGNRYLQNSFNKYGESNFVFEIIEYTTLEQLAVREHYYIQTLNPEYNISRSIDGRTIMSEESKNKIMQAQMIIRNSRKVYAKNLINGIITSYDSPSICSRELSINLRSVRKVLNRKRNIVNNYTFSYNQEFPTSIVSDKISSPVYVYNIEKELIKQFPSQKQCSEELKVSYGFLHRLIKSGNPYKNTYYFSKTLLCH